MPYYVIKDFARGLDARRLLETTEVGALIEARNAHISRGGELEKRKAFKLERTLAPGTHGLWVDDDGTITVFGSIERPGALAAEVNYIRCQHPDSATAMHRVLSQDAFFGKPYIVAEFVDGTVHHFYNGRIILDSGVPVDYEPPPTPPEEPEPEPPKYPVGNGRATASVKLYYVTGQGTPKIEDIWIAKRAITRDWFNKEIIVDFEDKNPLIDPAKLPLIVDKDDVPAAVKTLADEINAYDNGVIKCYARANYNELIVSVAEYGADGNDWVLGLIKTPNLAADTRASFFRFSGGQDLPPPDVPEGEEEPTEPVPEEFRWSPGRFATTYRQKVYATSESMLYFSAIDNCEMWTPDATGAGFIDVSTHAKGNQHLTAIGEYQNYLAAFSAKQAQLWIMDPDPRRNQLVQVIQNTGTMAPRSVTGFGTGELMYLDRSGIRAISARAIENVAYMSDIGSMIDSLVTDQLATMTPTEISKAIGLVEPQDGRFWMIVGDRIYVLSYFPTSKISAWTLYEPGFTADYADTTNWNVWLRSGDDIYSFGDEYGSDYEVVGQIPFLDFQRPGTTKTLNGLDVALSGSWKVRAALDPTRPDAFATIGTLEQSTYSYGRVALYGAATHVSLRFIHKGEGPARIGAAAVHYHESESG